MQELYFYAKLGIYHVLDLKAYDHVLFFIALLIPYTFKDFKKIAALVTLFTIGHTLSLILSVYDLVYLDSVLIEFFIPASIAFTALFYLIQTIQNKTNNNFKVTSFITIIFGLIHGLGFSNYFKTILPGNASQKILPLLQFALGIEIAQILVVLVVLIITTLVIKFTKFTSRDWAIFLAALILGAVSNMLINNPIWE